MNYLKVATEIASLLKSKNEGYGDAINRTEAIVRILFNKAPDLFDKRIQIIIRVLDKVCRECTKSDIENWKDIAGYAIRMVCEMEADKEEAIFSLKELAKADQPIVEGHSKRSEKQCIGAHGYHDECPCGWNKDMEGLY